MASPSSSLATQRPELATLVELDLQATHMGFIGHELFPVMEVPTQAGTFGRIVLNQLLKQSSADGKGNARAPGSTYERDGYTFTDDNYATVEYGMEGTIDDRERRMYSNYLDGDAVATVRAVDNTLREAEIRIRDAVYDNIPGGQQTAVSAGVWSIGTSDPITDVENAVLAVRNRTGVAPNALQMEWEAYKRLRNHPQLIDRIKHQGFLDARATFVNKSAMALFFDLDFIIVSGAGNMTNAANQGAADASLSPLWDKTKAIICRVATGGDVAMEPCIGRTFHWGEDGSTVGGSIESYRDEPRRGDVVRVRHDVHEKSLYPECAQMITGVLA